MKIISSWDGASPTDFKMADLMSKYNIPTIFYWPSLLEKAKPIFSQTSWLTEKDCKSLSQQFEIGSLSATNKPMKKMTINQLAMEITDSRKYWQDLTGQEIKSFAYPKSSINSVTKCLIKGAGYKSARTYIPNHLSPGDDPFEIKCTIQVGIDRVEYNDKSWELFWEEISCKTNEDSIFHIFGSSCDIEVSKDWDNLERLLKSLIKI